MRAKWMLAAIGATSVIAAAAALAPSVDLQPMIIAGLAGTVRIQQHIPCRGNVDQTIAITGGRLELTPSASGEVPGGKLSMLTRANVSFAPFSVQGSCLGFNSTRDYTEAEIQLTKAASFTAAAAGGDVYNVTIPKGDFRLFEAAIVNGALETGYKHPSEDVTGTINLTTGAVTMHVVLVTKIHFEAGCVPRAGCIVNEDDDGRLTANLTGTIVAADTDGDGVPDRTDNCRLTPNPTQSTVDTPVVTPPFDLTVASCADHRIGAAIGADVCDGGPVVLTNNALPTFSAGPNVVTWSGEDSSHRTGTAPQIVTVVDTTPPVITSIPPDLSLNNCGSPALGLPTATDDCAGPVGFTNNAPTSFGVGATVVRWTATDVAGNHTSATQRVTVGDTVAPAVSCVPAGPPGGTFQVSATDACTSAPVTRLGSFVLANGERIKINETGQSGVTLIGTVGPDHIRHFHVGKGEAIITATDASNNVGSAICR